MINIAKIANKRITQKTQTYRNETTNKKNRNFKFFIFSWFFFYERVFTDFNETKMTWKQRKLWIQKKFFIDNYKLSVVRCFIAVFCFLCSWYNYKATALFKTYFDFSHKNNRGFPHKKPHFWSALTNFSVQSKKKQSHFFFCFENASVAL